MLEVMGRQDEKAGNDHGSKNQVLECAENPKTITGTMNLSLGVGLVD